MEKVYEQKLNQYYVATIAYLLFLIIYAMVKGTLIDERFSLILKDPIVYVLVLCALVSIVALIVAVILNKRVIIRDRELVFVTRFKTRTLTPERIESISFRSGSRTRVRQGIPERAARLKLKGRRRLLWIRPSAFDRHEEMMEQLREWTRRNGVAIVQRRRRGAGKGVGSGD